MDNTATTKSTNWLFWLGFFVVIIVLALITTFAAIRGGQQLVNKNKTVIAQEDITDLPAPTPVIDLILNGQTHTVDEKTIGHLPTLTEKTLNEQKIQKNNEIAQLIQTEIDAAFEPALQNIPAFTDWYYSLTGEYSRYLTAVTGDMGDFLADKMHETIFKSANFSETINAKQQLFDTQLTQDFQESTSVLKQTLLDFLTQNALPAETPTVQVTSSKDETTNLLSVLDKHLAITSADIGKQVVAGLAGTAVGVVAVKGLGALVIKKTIAKVAGTSLFKTAGALLAKLAAKAAVKGGGAGAATVGGAAVCAPLGPGALACGAVAGIATWLLVDEAFIKLDEAINREAFEAEIRQAIIHQRDEIKRDLTTVYVNVFNERINAVSLDMSKHVENIQKTFIPADALRK
ncbi:hypothetical protein BegalDRAFT_1641 [Beggiatoa alba B18LD]|uniref:Uncharacterized protein n=1 Tax=Beggiatoa alba B18LD TaxID=395493 RepID=I3CFX7_9GAMM|nr:hypothetical protein [Beggiatoa alba]EIJ42520.1 hypothetical protein BegalDRAFT_1641 [Beggiatoa alba B18LD]